MFCLDWKQQRMGSKAVPHSTFHPFNPSPPSPLAITLYIPLFLEAPSPFQDHLHHMGCWRGKGFTEQAPVISHKWINSCLSVWAFQPFLISRSTLRLNPRYSSPLISLWGRTKAHCMKQEAGVLRPSILLFVLADCMCAKAKKTEVTRIGFRPLP